MIGTKNAARSERLPTMYVLHLQVGFRWAAGDVIKFANDVFISNNVLPFKKINDRNIKSLMHPYTQRLIMSSRKLV